MIGTETHSKLFFEYFECSSRKERHTATKQTCQHLPGSINTMQEKQIIFWPNQSICYLLQLVEYFFLPLLHDVAGTLKQDILLWKGTNLLFSTSACLSPPFLSAFAIKAFPLSEFPHLWQGCSAGFIWSVTVTRVIWWAMDVEANTVPLCSVLENVCVRNNSKMGGSKYPVGSHRAQPKPLNHSLMDGFPAEAPQ